MTLVDVGPPPDDEHDDRDHQADTADSTGSPFDAEPIRTSLKLRPVVHAYFRDRAHEQKISMQKLIESLCEGAFAEWTAHTAARTRRAAKRKETP